jgi:hypothetical protein
MALKGCILRFIRRRRHYKRLVAPKGTACHLQLATNAPDSHDTTTVRPAPDDSLAPAYLRAHTMAKLHCLGIADGSDLEPVRRHRDCWRAYGGKAKQCGAGSDED